MLEVLIPILAFVCVMTLGGGLVLALSSRRRSLKPRLADHTETPEDNETQTEPTTLGGGLTAFLAKNVILGLGVSIALLVILRLYMMGRIACRDALLETQLIDAMDSDSIRRAWGPTDMQPVSSSRAACAHAS